MRKSNLRVRENPPPQKIKESKKSKSKWKNKINNYYR